MTSRHVQYFLALIFIGLGGWCLVMPHTVEALVFRPAHQHLTPASAILMGCFGAQAVLVGTVIAAADFRPSTFMIFGLIASLPFFVFNVYFYFVAQIFTDWMLLDVVGNVGILACGVIGYRLKANELAEIN
ncbi:MAG: hypothetical protein ACR2PI_01960 [Hyphomicrobiaceae bacterium]